ncbi:MAG: hypothetical protein KAJ29_06600 [Alphaproteobacteria bacterium]|nr:hypothetical protein [Alphaproteobacteria bacterium]
MPEIQNYTREQIAEFLPDALEIALASYKKFSNMPATEEPSKFKARHDASKVAVSHIQLLMKLAQWADLPEDPTEVLGEDKQEQLRRMIENAGCEVKAYTGE